MRETGKKHAAQLTSQEKVLARLTIIYKDTAQAQGDFQRTSGGLANQLRIAQANIDQMQTSLGQVLVPAVTKAVSAFNDWIGKTENQQKVLDTFKDVVGAAGTVVDVLRGAFEKLNKITGSTKRSVELLVGVFVVFKAAKFAATILDIVGSMNKLKTATKLATVEQEALNTAQAGGGLGGKAGKAGRALSFGKLGPAAVAAAAIGVLVYGATRPKSATYGARQQYSKVGNRYYRIVPTRAGGPQRVEVSADEYYAATGKTPPPQAMPSRTPLDPRRFFPTPPAAPAAPAPPRPLSLLGRFNIQELKLAQAQLTKTLADDRKILVVEQAITVQQIKHAKTLKDRTKLTQQLAGIVGQIRGIVKAQTDARKAAAMDALQFKVDRAGATAAVGDDIQALRRLNEAITKQMREEGVTTDLLRQRFQNQQQIKQLQDQRRQTKLDWLEFGLEKAQATKKVGDDVKAEKKIIAALKEQVRQTGITVDLARQLFEHRQALKDLLKKKGGKTLLEAGFQYSGFAPGELPPMLRPSSKPLPLPPALQLPAGKPTVVINGGLHLHGVHDVPALESELLKRSTTRPQTRRGRR